MDLFSRKSTYNWTYSANTQGIEHTRYWTHKVLNTQGIEQNDQHRRDSFSAFSCETSLLTLSVLLSNRDLISSRFEVVGFDGPKFFLGDLEKHPILFSFTPFISANLPIIPSFRNRYREPEVCFVYCDLDIFHWLFSETIDGEYALCFSTGAGDRGTGHKRVGGSHTENEMLNPWYKK